MEQFKRRRATVIYESEQGILLTRISKEPWILPGGHAEAHEPRIIAAIREMQEETGLLATNVKYLFDFESVHYFQKVFLISAEGIASPCSEIKYLTYYHPQNPELIPEINRSSFQIIQKYLGLN